MRVAAFSVAVGEPLLWAWLATGVVLVALALTSRAGRWRPGRHHRAVGRPAAWVSEQGSVRGRVVGVAHALDGSPVVIVRAEDRRDVIIVGPQAQNILRETP